MASTIEVRGVSKRYDLGGRAPQGETFREFLSRHSRKSLKLLPTAQKGVGQAPFWALQDVNFDVHQGDVLGILGSNGAGKSTLLKIISRITDPTTGFVKVRGRMASLLEVGTGFHPELSGRENIFLNGAILGMRRSEIQSKFDEIVNFADVHKFLDTPVKHFSSGMYVRLAFAVAAHLEPEILLIDEVLAVGDVVFQKKCLGKITEISRTGRTVLFVSHNMAAIENLCSKGIVLSQGSVAFNGTSRDAIDYYLQAAFQSNAVSDFHSFDLTASRGRPAKHLPLLKKVELWTDGGRRVTHGVPLGAPLKIAVSFDLPNPTSSFNVGIGFDNHFGQRIFTAHSLFEPERDSQIRVGEQTFFCDLPSFTLFPGEYRIRVWLDIANAEADLVDDAARLNVLESDYYGTGKAPWNGTVVLKHRWYFDATNCSDPVPAAEKFIEHT